MAVLAGKIVAREALGFLGRLRADQREGLGDQPGGVLLACQSACPTGDDLADP
jgi:hypothetical protein